LGTLAETACGTSLHPPLSKGGWRWQQPCGCGAAAAAVLLLNRKKHTESVGQTAAFWLKGRL